MANLQRVKNHERVRIVSVAGFCAVFLAAVAVRYAFVAELRDESYLGNIRVSDARTYFTLAQQIASGTAPEDPYWQAPFYPLLLALFQSFFGNGLHTVQWLHIAVGALNCALLFRLTDGLFGARVAWIAAGIGILYAPFWIFDAQPLPANLTVLLYLVLASLYLRFRETGSRVLLACAGFVLGLVITTHGLALFTLLVFLYDLSKRSYDRASSAAACIAIFLATTAVAPGAVSARNSIVADAPIFVSYNAGINLYVGNSGDLEQTLARRGGYEWGELFRAPYTSGAKAPADMNRFFVEQAAGEFVEAPGAVALDFGKKLLMAIAGSEQKRNFPIYDLRESSGFLRALLFEVKAFGIVWLAFPAGLVIPLAAFGFFRLRRTASSLDDGVPHRAFPGWVALLHIVGMLVFFPTARYRVPAMMLLLPYAALALVATWDALAKRERLAPGLVIAAVASLILVNPVASGVFRHPVKERAEHLYFMARWDLEKLRHMKSESIGRRIVATASESMRVDPTYPEPVELLGLYYLDRDIDLALSYLAKLDQLVPDDGDVRERIRDALEIRDARLGNTTAPESVNRDP